MYDVLLVTCDVRRGRAMCDVRRATCHVRTTPPGQRVPGRADRGVPAL